MNFKQLTHNLLVPPGNGVYTVNTAKERKEALHQKLYQTTEGVEEAWKAQFKKLNDAEVAIVGVCSDTGGGILRGANWGPLFLRQTLHKNHAAVINHEKVHDTGDFRVIPHLLHDKYLNDPTIENCQKALFNDTKSGLPVSPLSITEHWLEKFYAQFPDKKVFAIGGDHSVSYPLTKTYLKSKRDQGKKVAIIHFDAHTDLLTERLGIDLCFGSWCTHILEFLPSADHLIQLGIRSSGKDRGHWEKTFGVQQFWSDQIIDEGPEAIANKVLSFLEEKKVDELYVSFDIDALDAEYASATGTPEENGLAPYQCSYIIKALAAKFPITGADMVEIAPFLNTKDTQSQETTLTVGAALSSLLLESMLN